ncbi:MAG: nitroreductase/quinone reductase family protein [Pseudomonadota bacterium]
MTALYTVINPIVRGLLKSPCHRLLSGNTMLLRYRGRKSGRQYELPISYSRDSNRICGFASRDSKWWRNLESGADVGLRLAGRSITARARVETADLAEIGTGLDRFLRAVPRDAGPAGVRLRADGTPEPADVAAASAKLVAVYFEPC